MGFFSAKVHFLYFIAGCPVGSGPRSLQSSGVLKEFMDKNQLTAQVTVSDEAEYAVAFVIVEQAN